MGVYTYAYFVGVYANVSFLLKMSKIKCLLGKATNAKTPRDTKNMNIVSNWHLECNGFIKGLRAFRVWAEEECFCPICVGKLIKKGLRTRFLIRIKPGATEDDISPYEKICLLVQRQKCKGCGKIHHQLPDCIVPYKRFDLEIIEGVIRNTEKHTLIDLDTIKRILAWWALMVAYILGVATSLEAKYQAFISPEQKLVKIVRALANSHLWPGTRSFFSSSG